MGDQGCGIAWFTNHPKILEMKETGIASKECHGIVLTVYLHLIEVKHWFDVCIHPLQHSDCFVLSGFKTSEKLNREVILPLSAHVNVEIQRLDRILDDACDAGFCNQDSLTLAIVEADSKIIFLKFAKGLVPPNEPRNETASKRRPVWSEKQKRWKNL